MFRGLEVISVTGSHPFYQMQAALFYRRALPATNCDTLWGWFFGGDTWSHILWNAGSIVLWQSSTQLQIATHCGTLVECPHLKRTKTMHFHSFLPPPTGYLPESDVQALLMAIELMGETTWKSSLFIFCWKTLPHCLNDQASSAWLHFLRGVYRACCSTTASFLIGQWGPLKLIDTRKTN